MSPRVTPPFRADHAGSLRRPAELISARERFRAGEITAEDLRLAEDQATAEVVALQEEIGLALATDGEFRRTTQPADFAQQFDGITEDAAADPGMRVDGKVGLPGTIFAEEFTALADRANTATPKLTIPAPGMLAQIDRSAVDADAYPDLSAFRADVAGAFARQVRGLSDLGCHYLQLDDTSFAALDDPAAPAAEAVRERRQLVDAVNTALSDLPATTTATLRLARGHRGPWITEGGHDATAEALFTGLAVDGFHLEVPDPAAADFSALRFVPRDRTVVLGLVDPSNAELESGDALKRQVDAASRHVDLEQLCLAPQRGFGSGEDALTEEQQLAKLRLVVETAREIWG